MQQYDFLRTAHYDPIGKRFEVKMVTSNQDPAAFLAGEDVATPDNTATYYRRVPWLFRAVDLRANAVASAPFRILRGETEVERSDTWRNSIGLMDNPVNLLWLTEAALTLWGTSYLWRDRNRVRSLGLRYVAPSTIEPELDSAAGLLGFWRSVGSQRRWATTDDLVYFWRPDPYVELGPPGGSAVTAAMSAAGVLFNIDAFAAAFFGRGAIKATLLTVEGNPAEDEKKRLRAWWQRAVGGIGNAFNANVFSMAVKPVTGGEGLESLSDSELTASKREDIATALGIPQTLLFSTGAGGLGGGGVVRQDEVHFYGKTIQPECDLIAAVLNSQLLRPMGYRLEFLLNTLDVFQADENERSGSFKTYVDAGLPIELVGEMLGLELPDGWTWEQIAADKEQRRAEMAAQMAPQPANANDDEGDDEEDQPAPKDSKAMLDDLRAWRRKSIKRGRLADFESEYIPAETMAGVRAAADWLAALNAAVDGSPFKTQVEPGRAAEDMLRRRLEAVLRAQRAVVAQAVVDGAEIDWEALMVELRAAVTPALAATATQQAAVYAAGLNIPLDIAKINVAAWTWANGYSYELIKGITATTQQVVSQAVAQFVGTPGMTIGDVIGMLETAFGPVRAQMIAVTETTRAYSHANRITQVLLREMGVETVRVWRTSADEKVCDICGPLEGKAEDDWGDLVDGPPGHVNCRCWTTSQVVRRNG